MEKFQLYSMYLAVAGIPTYILLLSIYCYLEYRIIEDDYKKYNNLK